MTEQEVMTFWNIYTECILLNHRANLTFISWHWFSKSEKLAIEYYNHGGVVYISFFTEKDIENYTEIKKAKEGELF